MGALGDVSFRGRTASLLCLLSACVRVWMCTRVCVCFWAIFGSNKMLWCRNGGGTCTKWLSHPYLSRSALMLISVKCRHPASIQVFWHFIDRVKARGNDGEDQRRRIRRRSGWNVQHLQQSHCSAFTQGWLPLYFETYPGAQKSEHLMEKWIDDRKSKNGNKYEMRASGGKGSL